MSWYETRGKRVLDVALSLPLVLLTAPIVVILALVILVVDRQRPLLRQNRLGLDGSLFGMWKLRTMRQESGPTVTSVDDPRVTRMGSWLRSSCVDELPQLWNVLLGHMSLVGPRPEMPENVGLYPPDFAKRLSTRPGLTGRTQIHSRSVRGFSDVLRVDLDYVDSISLAGDLQILGRTPSALWGKERVD